MRDSVTFVHAADLHLDAPFQGLREVDERVGRELAEATYQAWRRIVDLAIEREVDFVVLAGDLYNSGDRSLRAQIRVREQAQRLADAGIALFVAHGNHDPLDGWSAGLAMPESVHVFGGRETRRIVAVESGEFICAVYGRSFATREELSDFTPGYAREPADTIAVGVLHANVGNNADYDPYAPCTLDALRAARMDYWALGHIHKHEILLTDPYAVYAGSPQGLNPKEIGAHGCCVVSMSSGGAVKLEHVDLAPVVWAVDDVRVDGIDSVDRLEALLNERLSELRHAAGRPVVARLRLVGRAKVHADLTRPAVIRDLTEALRSEQLSHEPWGWLDSLVDATGAVLDLDALADSPEFSGELVRIATELASDEEGLAELLESVVAPVAEKLSDYTPQASSEELLERARDRALDLLLTEDGSAREA